MSSGKRERRSEDRPSSILKLESTIQIIGKKKTRASSEPMRPKSAGAGASSRPALPDHAATSLASAARSRRMKTSPTPTTIAVSTTAIADP